MAEALFDRLKAACSGEWQAYTGHEFVEKLGQGMLPETAFRYYLQQDYLFLIHFARAYALAAFKADTLADIRQAAAGLTAIVDREMGLHVAYCARWGLSEEDMATMPEDPANMAYTRYVLEAGLAGDSLDLAVALAPCVVGYAEIARRLAAASSAAADANPYREWIETYACDDYQEVAAAHAAHMDALFARRGGPGRDAALVRVFREATRLEAAFWQMGLDAAG